ncbi:MAG: non-homologous end-joining DNA ligase [Pseudomonadota bacterium]
MKTDAVTLTHPERILYPASGVTKLDLAAYYETVQEWMLPLVSKRLLTLVRSPQGDLQKCFYQKHLQEPNKSLFQLQVREKTATRDYLYLKNVDGLIALVQMGVLEIHCWGSNIKNVERPDLIVFDLDPAPDVNWSKVMTAAKFIRDQLATLHLTSFVKTTGGKGLHVVVPIKPRYSWEIVKQFSHDFVDNMVAENPRAYVATISKAKRTGKIFLDYLRNQHGATAVAPYSTRAREYATVATPIHWDELTAKLKPEKFTVKTLPKRLITLKSDPWEDFLEISQTLPR